MYANGETRYLTELKTTKELRRMRPKGGRHTVTPSLRQENARRRRRPTPPSHREFTLLCLIKRLAVISARPNPFIRKQCINY